NRTTQYLRTEVAGYEKVLPIEENIDNSSFSVFPNPSNGLVSFEYGLVTFGYVSVNVMDMSGREVIKVVNNQFYTPGEHRVQIDLQEERKIAPGVYLCRMKTDQGEKIQRLIIQ
ncbi:MAG: T9SS type A sorting domain-containing protein, partial [Tunicatimonas sp.]